MGVGQEFLGVGVIAPLQARPVVIAGAGELAVAWPAVGVDDRAGGDQRLHQASEGVLAGVGEYPRAKSPRAGTADFDEYADEGLLAAPAGDVAALADPSDERLVDLDLAAKRLALRRPYRAAQLLQDQPAAS